jgi:hypothetical protein
LNRGIAFLVFLVVLLGGIIAVASYLNLYVTNSTFVASGRVLFIDSSDYNAITFSTAVRNFKNVEVHFDPGPVGLVSYLGNCSPINSSLTDISLMDQKGNYVYLSAGAPPCEITAAPPSLVQGVWQLQVGNPEKYPADIVITVVVHSESINPLMVTTLLCGLVLVGAGVTVWRERKRL